VKHIEDEFDHHTGIGEYLRFHPLIFTFVDPSRELKEGNFPSVLRQFKTQMTVVCVPIG
jgi:hypothetical protein